VAAQELRSNIHQAVPRIHLNALQQERFAARLVHARFARRRPRVPRFLDERAMRL
jgi:hypothetical protein